MIYISSPGAVLCAFWLSRSLTVCLGCQLAWQACRSSASLHFGSASCAARTFAVELKGMWCEQLRTGGVKSPASYFLLACCCRCCGKVCCFVRQCAFVTIIANDIICSLYLSAQLKLSMCQAFRSSRRLNVYVATAAAGANSILHIS